MIYLRDRVVQENPGTWWAAKAESGAGLKHHMMAREVDQGEEGQETVGQVKVC